MRVLLLLAIASLTVGCFVQEPNMDGGVEICGDAATVACLRGSPVQCDRDDRTASTCRLRPPCVCRCPAGYVAEHECGS